MVVDCTGELMVHYVSSDVKKKQRMGRKEGTVWRMYCVNFLANDVC